MDTTATDTRPTFSRLTEGKTRYSWRAAVPEHRRPRSGPEWQRLRDQVGPSADRPRKIGHVDHGRPGREAARRRGRERGPAEVEADPDHCAAAGPGATRRAGARDSDPAGEERRGKPADAPTPPVRRAAPPPAAARAHAPPRFGRGFPRAQPPL